MIKLNLKRIIATLLVVAMTFTNAGFMTLAESVDDAIKTSQTEKLSESEEQTDLSHKYYDEKIAENSDVVLEEAYDEVDENSKTNEEEDEKETEELVKKDSSDKEEKVKESESSSDFDVVEDDSKAVNEEDTEKEADETSEEKTSLNAKNNIDTTNDSSDNLDIMETKISIEDEELATASDAEEENIATSLDAEEENIATISDAEEENIATASDAEEENIATTSNADIATESETIYIDVATFSEVIDLDIASVSEIATESSLNLSKLMVASAPLDETNLFGAVDLKVGDRITWGSIKYGTDNVKIPWEVLQVNKAKGTIVLQSVKILAQELLYHKNVEESFVINDKKNKLNKLKEKIITEQDATIIDIDLPYSDGTKYYIHSSIKDGGDIRPWNEPQFYYVNKLASNALNSYVYCYANYDGIVESERNAFDNLNKHGIAPKIKIKCAHTINWDFTEYKITWDLKDGSTSNTGSWNGTAGSSKYTYGTGISKLPTNVNGPTGKVFDYWTIGGTKATSIAANATGDKTIKAVYKNAEYKITWDLKDGSTSNTGSWNGTAGSSKYTYGTGISKLPTNVNGPTGKIFDYWTIGGTKATSIAANATGDKTIKAVYKNAEYKITWDLKDGSSNNTGSWNGTAGSSKYTYGTGISKLPTNVNGPTGKVFDYWTIGGTKATSIAANATGDKTIKAVYKNAEYKITWDLKDGSTSNTGSWNGTAGSSKYTYGTGISKLPTNVKGPTGKVFDYWTIGGTKATSIAANATGDKTIKAVYKEKEYKYQFKAVHPKGADGKEHGTTSNKTESKITYFSQLTMPTADAWNIEGFKLLGFNTSSSATSAKWNANTKYNIKDIGWSETAVNYIYPVYQELEYEVDYAGGNATGVDKVKYTSSYSKKGNKYKYWGKATLPKDVTLTGFNLIGYNKAAGQTSATVEAGKEYQVKALVANNTFASGAKTTLYATWKEKEYKLEILGGSKTVGSKTYTSTSKVNANTYKYYSKVTMPDTTGMSLYGFKLKGFNKADKQTSAKYGAKAVVKVTDLISYIPMVEASGTNPTVNKLYAVWEVVNATVSLNADTGVFKSNNKRQKTLSLNKPGTALKNYADYEEPVTVDGFVFDYWLDNDGNKWTKDDVVVGDRNLKAVYKKTGTGGTSESEQKQKYTIRVINDVSKGVVKVNGVESTDARFSVKVGDKILDALTKDKVTVEDKPGWNFEGWSWTGDVKKLVKETEKYSDTAKTTITAVYTPITNVKVILKANTGIFESDSTRERTIIASVSTTLRDFNLYEEPKKAGDFVFEKWVDQYGNDITANDIIYKDKILKAVYKNSKTGTEVGDDTHTDDGGDNATYTITLKTDPSKGTLGSVSSFEIKKDEKVLEAMRNAGVVDPTTTDAYNFWGWSFSDDIAYIIDETTTYTDTNKTELYAEYYEKGLITVILDANTGLFSNNETTRTLTSETWLELNKFTNYEIPGKSEGYTFNGWIDESKNAFAENTLMQSLVPVRLYATYKDPSGNVIGDDEKTEDGGEDATYTIQLTSDTSKGELGSVKRFEIKLGDAVMVKMKDAGITTPIAKEPYSFVGWSFEDRYETALLESTVYDDSSKRVLHALYSSERYTVILKANTGIFSDNTREKILQVNKNIRLISLPDYEEPKKGDGFTFEKWEKDGAKVENIESFIVDEDMTLVAVYKDKNGDEVGNNDDTEDGGKDAIYTIRVINDDTKGTYDGVGYFELKLNDNVMTEMSNQGVTEGVGNEDYLFQGFAFNDELLINKDTIYDDKEKTTLTLMYISTSYKSSITLDAWVGQFADGNRYKVYNDVAEGRIINTLPGYEEPTRDGWTFSRWVDETNNTVEATSGIRSGNTTLYAIFLDESGNEVSIGLHSHYVCGDTNLCAHTDGVLRVHSFAQSYTAVTNGSEIVNYVNAEVAKDVANRKNIYLYLTKDVDINENIELDTNVKLYICLNGYNLNTKKILAKEGSTNSEVIIANCQNNDVKVTELESENNTAMFGTNGIHIFGNESTIVLSPKAALVNVKGESSDIDKEIVLQKVDIEGAEVKDTEFISIEGNSNIKLVDVNIKNVVADKAIIKVDENAKLLIGNEVNIINCQSMKAIIDDDGVFNIVDNAKLTVNGNIINKKENGTNGIILLGSANNYVSGDLIVTNNKLNITDEYLNVLTIKNDESVFETMGNAVKNLFGAFAEDESPAGDVGYTAAIGFKNANTTIEVKNSKVVVADNDSSDNAKDLKAGYMYNVLSQDAIAPVFTQVKGTALSADSNIGVAFATTDGEGNITYNREVNNNIFKNTTYGKEEKILTVKENSMGYGIKRKTYQIEYDEGTPITKESKMHIPAYTRDRETPSEATRVRVLERTAGYDTLLEDNTIYKAFGFDLASYSVIRPSTKEMVKLSPRATLSYIDDIFDDNAEIEDNEVIKVVSNWEERKLNSEAKEVVITKEEYEQLVEVAVKDAEVAVASYSEVEQVVVESDEDYYTVRYWLDGGHFEGSEVPEIGYVDDTKVNRKEKYILSDDVIKIATESGVNVSYDFIGWSMKESSADDSSDDIIDDLYGRSEASINIIEELEAGVEGELIELVANYKPSTYKITYHLNGGNINGAQNDVEDIVVRTSDYVLIKNAVKDGYAFIGWTREDAEVSATNPVIEEFEKETLESDIEVYAQYSSLYYSVKYHFDGGKTRDIEIVDDVYVDEKVDVRKDYHLLDEVEKVGFDFIGWVTVDGEIPIDVIEVGDKDLSKREVKARYRSITYTVNYDTDGGTIVGVESNVAKPEVGKIYVLYTNVEKEGYEFLGWFDVNTDRQILSIGSAQVGEVYKVKAKWAKKAYSLKLHLNGGKLVSAGATGDYTINDISNLTDFVLPTDIEKENQELKDWYYVKNGVNTIVDTIKAGNPDNITDVYARYEDIVTHKIVYHLKYKPYSREDEKIPGVKADYHVIRFFQFDSDETIYTQTVNRRNDHYLYTNVEREGWTFVGWTTKRYAVNSLDIVNDADKIFTKKPGVTKKEEQDNSKLKIQTYDYYPYFITKANKTAYIKYVLNGGFIPGKMTSAGLEYSEQVSIDKTCVLNQDIIRDGYRFDGWYLSDDYSGEAVKYIYKEELAEKVDSTIPVYAKWTKDTYSLKYHVNGGTMIGKALTEGNKVYSTTFLNEKDFVLDTDIVRNGYSFDGWYDGEEENAKKVEMIPAGTDKDIEVYARWVKNTYTITYELEGGRVSGAIGHTYKVTYNKDNTNTLITNVTKNGYEFMGWYTERNGFGNKVVLIEKSETPLPDVKVYAYFKDVKYKVTFVLDGGSIKGKRLNKKGNFEEEYDNREEVTLYDDTKVTREYDKFLAWVDENGKEWSTIPVDHEGDLTLKATYKLAKVNLVYNFEGAYIPGVTTKEDKITKIKVQYNSTEDYILLPKAEWKKTQAGKPEWVFDGWETKDGKKITMIPKDSDETITEVTATWYYGAYQLEYHVDGGNIGVQKPNYMGVIRAGGNVYSEKKLPTNVTKENSVFGGWYLEPDFSGEPITVIPKFTTLGRNFIIPLYAKWIQDKYTISYNVEGGAFKNVSAKGKRLTVSVENKYPYILLDEENLSYPGYEFDGWYEATASGKLVGDAVVWIDAENKDNYELHAKFVNIKNASDKEKTELENHKKDRQSKKAEGIAKREKMINDDISSATENIKTIYNPAGPGLYDIFTKQFVEEDKNRKKNSDSQQEEANSSLFGSVFENFTSLFKESNGTALYGDDENENIGDVIEINTSSLNAYDSVSAKNLGINEKKGYVLSGFLLTYIEDADGNDVYDELLGTIYTPSDNFSNVAEKYPNSTIGGRVIFIDEALLKAPEDPDKPDTPSDPTPSDPTPSDPTPSDPDTPSDPTPSDPKTPDKPNKPGSGPSNPGGGNGGGGGGGGGRGGSAGLAAYSGNDSILTQAHATPLTFVMQTPILEHEYTWVYDDHGRRIGANLNIDSIVASAMVKSPTTKGAYELSKDGYTIKLGGGGIYRMYYRGQETWFGFDKNYNLMTGFILTTPQTKMLSVSPTVVTQLLSTASMDGNTVFSEAAGIDGKYYLYELDGDQRGILWNQPVTVRNVQYTFTLDGRVLTEVALSISTNSNTSLLGKTIAETWQYDPINNTWKYIVIDSLGNARYLVNTVREITGNGITGWYIFDENGNMKTGLTEYNGKTYYLQEAGINRGAVYVGDIVLNGKNYSFDLTGALVTT